MERSSLEAPLSTARSALARERAMNREPEGLVARIRQIRRTFGSPDPSWQPQQMPSGDPGPPELADLQARLAHLEQLVQGLQDSVHRESQRQEERISELEERVVPSALAAALSKDARERGL